MREISHCEPFRSESVPAAGRVLQLPYTFSRILWYVPLVVNVVHLVWLQRDVYYLVTSDFSERINNMNKHITYVMFLEVRHGYV